MRRRQVSRQRAGAGPNRRIIGANPADHLRRHVLRESKRAAVVIQADESLLRHSTQNLFVRNDLGHRALLRYRPKEMIHMPMNSVNDALVQGLRSSKMMLRRYSEDLKPEEYLHRATPEQLNKPVENPRPVFSTPGEAMVFAAVHTMLHVGQITLIRRNLGRPPLS